MIISVSLILGQSMIGLLAYANKIVILGNNIQTVKILCVKLREATGRFCLIINYGKTDYMKLNWEQKIIYHGKGLEAERLIFYRVYQFKYLGLMLTQEKN